MEKRLEPGLARRLRERIAQGGAAPLWSRLSDGLRQALADGTLGPGARIPGERTLARDLGVSRVTLRRAIEALEEDGVLRRHQGSRTEVVARLQKAVSRLAGFSEDMIARGRRPGATWLARSLDDATPAEAEALGLSPGARVARLDRVRLADGEPVAIERAVIPAAILPSPDLVGESLYEALGARGARPVRGTQRLRAVPARPREARLLGCEPGTPLVSVERRCFDAAGACVELTETRYLGAAYEFVTDLEL